MQQDWNLEDLHAVAIIQNWDSHEILQAAQINLIPTSVNDLVVPIEISLHQNYPNPFNPITTISFSLNTGNTDQNAEIIIHNLKGQKIKKLEVRNLKLGINNVEWDGTDDNNQHYQATYISIN